MALTTTQVSQLYVSIFNRASEGNGNTFWATNASTVADAANQMLATTDAATYFGTSLATNQAFIEHIYLNTLNKTVAQDAAGVAYWVSLLDGGASRGTVVASLVDAVAQYATSTDATTKAAYDQFTSRVAVSNYTAATMATAPTDYASSLSFQSLSNPNGGLVVTNYASAITAEQTVAALAAGTTTAAHTFTLTTGLDNIAGTTGNDTINATDGTLTGLDVINGGAGVDTLIVNDITGATADFTTSTISNVENLTLNSSAGLTAGAIHTTVMTGLTSATINLKAAVAQTITAATTTEVHVTDTLAGAITVVGSKGNVSVSTGAAAVIIGNNGASTAADANAITSATVTGGTTVKVTDNSNATTAGAIGSTLTTVTLTQATGSLGATLTGNAISTVNVNNGLAGGSATVVNAATAAQTINLNLDKSAAGFQFTDASAKTVNVAANGTSAATVDLTIAAATTLNTSGAAAMTLATVAENYTALTTLNIANTGAFNADLSAANTASAAAITSIVATSSTGANTLSIDATKTTYAGGSGVDNVTIAAAPTKAINGGAGTADVLTVNIATAFNASANTNISGFETLGLGVLAGAVAYDATGFSHLTTGNTAVGGASSFTNVAAGTDLTFTATNANVITYTLANATGLTDSMNVTMTSAAAISDKLTATGVETVHVNAVNTTVGTTGAVALMDTLLLSAAPTSGATSNFVFTSSALAGITLTDTTDLTISTVDASGVQGDGAGTAGTGFVWTTGILAATTVTTATTITGSANGGDTINASAALDLVTITETKGTNTLTGSATNVSHITGGTGADTITGGAAADVIVGGGGADIIKGGAGADTITVSGATSQIFQATIGDSGVNTSTTIQTSELTSTFDVVTGLVAGDTIKLATATPAVVLAAANLAGTDDKVNFAAGTYDSAAGTFTYAANGHDTAMTYDTTVGVGTAFETVVLVGYHAGATTAVAAGVITLA